MEYFAAGRVWLNPEQRGRQHCRRFRAELHARRRLLPCLGSSIRSASVFGPSTRWNLFRGLRRRALCRLHSGGEDVLMNALLTAMSRPRRTRRPGSCAGALGDRDGANPAAPARHHLRGSHSEHGFWSAISACSKLYGTPAACTPGGRTSASLSNTEPAADGRRRLGHYGHRGYRSDLSLGGGEGHPWHWERKPARDCRALRDRESLVRQQPHRYAILRRLA